MDYTTVTELILYNIISFFFVSVYLKIVMKKTRYFSFLFFIGSAFFLIFFFVSPFPGDELVAQAKEQLAVSPHQAWVIEFSV